MKPEVAMIYLSTSGNTRAVARVLADRMAPWASVTIMTVDEAERLPDQLQRADLLGLGSPVFHLRSADRVARLIRRLPHTQRSSPVRMQKRAFLFCTYAGISSGLALLDPARALRRRGYTLLGALKVKAVHFYDTEAHFPNDETELAAERFAAELAQRVAAAPSQRELFRKLDYQSNRVKLVHKVIPVFSKRRVPVIVLDRALCTNCGACVRLCPAGAMSIVDGFPDIDGRSCMHCYRCAEHCRPHALRYDRERLRRIVDFNKRTLGLEEPATAVI